MYSIGQYDPRKWLLSCYNFQNWIRTIELSCNLRYCDTYRRFKCVYLWYCRWKAIQHNWGVLLNLLPSKQYTDKRHVLPIKAESRSTTVTRSDHNSWRSDMLCSASGVDFYYMYSLMGAPLITAMMICLIMPDTIKERVEKVAAHSN